MVTAPILYVCEPMAETLPAGSFAKYFSVALLAILTVTGDAPRALAVVGVVPSVVKKMVAGSPAVITTDWAVVNWPPRGLAVTIGASVSMTRAELTVTLWLPAGSTPNTLKV